MVPYSLRARYRSAGEIKARGAIGNLRDGAEITTHGIATRLIAWPGTGYQTEAVHVLTVKPEQESEHWCYDLAEDALLCHSGQAQVWLRGQWIDMLPGYMAYFPPGIERAVRNPATNASDCILVNQITPPQIDLYADRGLYNVELGVMNLDSARKLSTNAMPANIPGDGRMGYRETALDVRPWKLELADVRSNGALFNVFRGTPFSGIGVPMRLILWPGAGSRTSGFNLAFGADGVEDVIHKHPVADECLFLWAGRGQFFFGDQWVDVEAGDCVLAPCGVAHGHRSVGPALFGGFASPPQLDLMISSDLYDHGRYRSPETTQLTFDL